MTAYAISLRVKSFDFLRRRPMNLSSKTAEVQAQNVVLRTLVPEDVSEAYVGWLNDAEVTKFLEVRHRPHAQADVEQFVADVFKSPNAILFGIFLKAESRHIGNIKLGPISWQYKRSDVGLMIGDKGSWGKGYGRQAIAALSDYAFGELGLNRLQAGAYANNIASIKAFESVGFQREGITREHWGFEGQPQDGVIMGLLAREKKK